MLGNNVFIIDFIDKLFNKINIYDQDIKNYSLFIKNYYSSNIISIIVNEYKNRERDMISPTLNKMNNTYINLNNE